MKFSFFFGASIVIAAAVSFLLDIWTNLFSEEVFGKIIITLSILLGAYVICGMLLRQYLKERKAKTHAPLE